MQQRFWESSGARMSCSQEEDERRQQELRKQEEAAAAAQAAQQEQQRRAAATPAQPPRGAQDRTSALRMAPGAAVDADIARDAVQAAEVCCTHEFATLSCTSTWTGCAMYADLAVPCVLICTDPGIVGLGLAQH